jgi:hypothetical protein
MCVAMCDALMSGRGAICSRLWLALCVCIGAGLPCVACGGRGQVVSNSTQIPPAEEPPWTKEATVTPDAGAARKDGEKPPGNSSTEAPNEER